jgi:hypothetical protein
MRLPIAGCGTFTKRIRNVVNLSLQAPLIAKGYQETVNVEGKAMERLEARLVQYRVLADHRLHFGRLYFQVIGINLLLLTGASTAIALGRPAWWASMRLIAGAILVFTGFIAHRLRHQEERYASALRAIEQETDMVELLDTSRHGARQLVVIALIGAGFLLAVEATYRLMP